MLSDRPASAGVIALFVRRLRLTRLMLDLAREI